MVLVEVKKEVFGLDLVRRLSHCELALMITMLMMEMVLEVVILLVLWDGGG